LKKKQLVRIPDWGVTEQIVIFADTFILNKVHRGKILDLGCGRGVFTEKIAEKAEHVVGIDIVPEIISYAKENHSRKNITYICFDAENLPELDGKFDLIISRFCFHHLDFNKAAPGIIAKVKPGGRLIAVDCFEDFWTPEGRLYVVKTAVKTIGLIPFLILSPRLFYFFTPPRIEHVVSDKKRLKEEKRYSFEEFIKFYKSYFPNADIDRIGCAMYIDWLKG